MKAHSTICIDLDNAPHVYFFAPIGRDLTELGSDPVYTLAQMQVFKRSWVPYEAKPNVTREFILQQICQLTS